MNKEQITHKTIITKNNKDFYSSVLPHVKIQEGDIIQHTINDKKRMEQNTR